MSAVLKTSLISCKPMQPNSYTLNIIIILQLFSVTVHTAVRDKHSYKTAVLYTRLVCASQPRVELLVLFTMCVTHTCTLSLILKAQQPESSASLKAASCPAGLIFFLVQIVDDCCVRWLYRMKPAQIADTSITRHWY